METKILFILKCRENYSEFYGDAPSYGNSFSSGLYNSARFVSQMLNENGIETKLVQVNDNNGIDREVSEFKPTHVVIEALWVVPEKFDILHKLHPTVQWIVRGHSEIPFLAQEGVALDWLCAYVQYQNVSIATNSEASVHDFRNIIKAANPDWTREEVKEKVLYLPNYYPYGEISKREKCPDEYLDVACFGAIRPLKNQLIQAVAAIEYADMIGKTLRFHINATRTEQKGENVLRNIRALFANTLHELVEHGWMHHKKFVKVLSKMDMSLCVSFTETFNIIAADSISVGVPVVGSKEIKFLSSWSQADPTDTEDIVLCMGRANDWRFRAALKILNQRGLRHFCTKSQGIWLDYLLF